MAWSKTYDGDEPVRVNKWLAQTGVCSRREAEGLIERGLIFIGDDPVVDMGHKVTKGQTVRLNEEGQTALDTKLTLIYHKPIGIVSGTPEAGEIPAVRMIRRANVFGKAETYPDQNSKLAPIGRLDKDSRGLLIMSEDGVLAKAIIGPESDLEKEYHVRVRGPVFEEKIKWLRHGLSLDGRQLKPAIVEQIDDQKLKFILKEGRNRQIRRMCEMVELRVTDLYRPRIGQIEIKNLPEGQWRPMTAAERQTLIRPSREREY